MDLSSWVGVGLGGNCDCRCGIFCAPMFGGGGILYKTVLARKLSKPEDGHYRPKHVAFLLLINTVI